MNQEKVKYTNKKLIWLMHNGINIIVSSVVVIIIGLIVSETVIVTAQEQNDSANLDKRTIIVTWLEPNKTNTDSATGISVSNGEFWKTFKALVEQSINGSK